MAFAELAGYEADAEAFGEFHPRGGSFRGNRRVLRVCLDDEREDKQHSQGHSQHFGFLSKEKLYPNSRFRMSDETLETYIRQLRESQRAPEVTIAWQGREPTLMGLDFFNRAVDSFY